MCEPRPPRHCEVCGERIANGIAICTNCPMPNDPKPEEIEKLFARRGRRIDHAEALRQALADDEREIQARFGGTTKHKKERLVFSSEHKLSQIEAEQIGDITPMSGVVFMLEAIGSTHKSMGMGRGSPSAVPGKRVHRHGKNMAASD